MDPPVSASETAYQQYIEEVALARERREKRTAETEDLVEPSSPFLIRLGRAPIHLTWIEFRIIRFLSLKPYKAYTREQIVNAVDVEKTSVNEHTLDFHVRSLRGKLGMFADFVQTVPYVGYRFKP